MLSVVFNFAMEMIGKKVLDLSVIVSYIICISLESEKNTYDKTYDFFNN